MRTLPILLLSLTACGAGRVTVEGLEPFDARSEVWTSEDDAHGDAQFIVLTNIDGYCEKAQAANEAFAATVALDVDEATYCRDAKDVMQAWAGAMSELWFDGAHYLQLHASGDGGATEIAVGEWGGDSTAHALGATLTYVDQDSYASYLEDWDEGAEEIDRCGVASGNELGPLPTRGLETGLMTVATLEAAAKVTGELEATFEALDGEDAAVEVTATFDAAWCELGADEG